MDESLRKKKKYRVKVDYYAPKKDRILENISINEDGCWMWTGTKSSLGYGLLHSKNDEGNIYIELGHRVAYSEFKGGLSKDIIVCHKCDVPSCVNPGTTLKTV